MHRTEVHLFTRADLRLGVDAAQRRVGAGLLRAAAGSACAALRSTTTPASTKPSEEHPANGADRRDYFPGQTTPWWRGTAATPLNTNFWTRRPSYVSVV